MSVDRTLKRARRKRRLAEALPSDETLGTQLVAALQNVTPGVDGIEIVHRTTNTYYSSHPSEVVDCKLEGENHRLLVKYGSPGGYLTHLSRAGVSYEAMVYERILHPHGISAPSLMGLLQIQPAGSTWLVIEYLSESDRLDDLETAVITAAGWLGQFHAYASDTWSLNDLEFLKVYDAAFYNFWVDAAVKRLELLAEHDTWISETMEDVRGFLADLPSRPPVVIHGEFYPHNVLVKNGAIHPIDWETAAFGLAEIDFVSLIDGWQPEIVEQCKIAYRNARWGKVGGKDFERSQLYADMYWNVRWLSGVGKRHKPQFDPAETTSRPPRLEHLRTLCDQLHHLNQD